MDRASSKPGARFRTGLSSLLFLVLLYPFGKLLTTVAFLIFGPLRVEGREHVPRRGPVLVCANHISDADPPAMFHAVPRPSWFLAKEELFNMGVIGLVVRLYRSIPVRRGAPDRRALRRAEELLLRGECVIIFPEGECSQSGKLLPILPGAALILRRTGATCVCAGIVGTNQIVRYGTLRPRKARGPVTIRFGKPLAFEGTDGPPSIQDIVQRIGEDLASLTGQAPPDVIQKPRGGPALHEGQNDDATS